MKIKDIKIGDYIYVYHSSYNQFNAKVIGENETYFYLIRDAYSIGEYKYPAEYKELSKNDKDFLGSKNIKVEYLKDNYTEKSEMFKNIKDDLNKLEKELPIPYYIKSKINYEY